MRTIINTIKSIINKNPKKICILYSDNQHELFIKISSEMKKNGILFNSIKLNCELQLAVLTELTNNLLIIINNLDCPKQSIAEYTHLLEKKNIVIYLESGEYYSEEFLEYFEADEKEIQYMNDIIGFQFRQSKNLRVTSLSGTNIEFEIYNNIAYTDDLREKNRSNIIQFPYGEVFFPIKAGTANGVIVIDGIKYTIRNGNMEYKYGRRSIPICEFGIGTNRKLINYKESKGSTFYEKVYGTCHFGFGDNITFGGDIKFPIHFDLVLDDYVCLDSNNRIIIENSKIENLPNYLIKITKDTNWKIEVDFFDYEKKNTYLYDYLYYKNYLIFNKTVTSITEIGSIESYSVQKENSSIKFLYEVDKMLWIGAPSRNLPMPYGEKGIYNIYLKENKESSYYTNNSKDLRKLLVIDKSNVLDIILEVVNTTVICSTLSKSGTEEIRKFLEYFKFYTKEINCKVLKVYYSFSLGASYENIILLMNEVCTNEKFMIFKYMIHEIIHQYLGFKIQFENEFVCEILTEFLQLLYIKRRFSRKTYAKYLDYYKKVAMVNRDEYFYSRGVLAFEKIFTEKIRTEANLKKFIEKISLDGNVSYVSFIKGLNESFNITNFDEILSKIKNFNL